MPCYLTFRQIRGGEREIKTENHSERKKRHKEKDTEGSEIKWVEVMRKR